MSSVHIQKLAAGGVDQQAVLRAFQWLEWEKIVPQNARVFIKPNLTWPQHLPGVTTTPQAIEAVVAALKQRTGRISVGESDGGYHAYKAEEAFAGHNLYSLQEKYGIQVVNLSDLPSETVVVEIARKKVSVSLPKLLLHETDVFITMPVPKMHVMTGVSLAFKNQWGCLPSPLRLREHPEFDHKILAINHLLNPRLAILDGTYFLNGAGPMTGDAIRKDLLIIGDDAGAASLATCAIMGIDPRTIRHLRLAQKINMMPSNLDQVRTNEEIGQYHGERFFMKRAFLDYISLLGFRSHFFTRLFWLSSTAGPLHKLLFSVRRIPLVEHFLYGKAGAPPEWKKNGSSEH